MEVSHHTPSEQEHSHPWPSANSGTVLILMRRPAQNSAAVTPTDFGRLPPLALTWVHRVPVPYVLSDSDVSANTVLTCLWQENTVNGETINTVFCLCQLANRPGTTFYSAKVFHVCRTASVFMLKTTEIFLSEQALNVYFHRFRHKPSDCRAAGVTLCEQRKNSSLTDGAKLRTKGKKIKNNSNNNSP